MSMGAGAELQLGRLLIAEIHGLKFLETDRSYLIDHISPVVAFSLIKAPQTNEITHSDLTRFLQDNGYAPCESDIEAIYYRLDHNKDGLITYSDFTNVYKEESDS